MRAVFSPAGGARAGALLLATSAAGFIAQPAAGQYEVGLGLGVADTDQNAIAVLSTLTRNFSVNPGGFALDLALRGFGDAEVAMPHFKRGLGYLEPARIWIVDGQGAPQRPEGDALWESYSWDAHLALYATSRVYWRIHLGPGLAYNGHDRSGGPAALVLVYVTPRTEVGVELLDPASPASSRWRLRLSLGFWQFP